MPGSRVAHAHRTAPHMVGGGLSTMRREYKKKCTFLFPSPKRSGIQSMELGTARDQSGKS